MNDNVTNSEFAIWKQQLEDQKKLIKEILESQKKVETALLGSLESTNVGLFTQVREQGKDIEGACQEIHGHTMKIAEMSDDVRDLKEFKSNIKKIVAFIAVFIPFSFEIIKFLGGLIWGYFKGGGSNTP